MSMQDATRSMAKAKDLTKEQKDRLGRAALAVWDNIGTPDDVPTQRIMEFLASIEESQTSP